MSVEDLGTLSSRSAFFSNAPSWGLAFPGRKRSPGCCRYRFPAGTAATTSPAQARQALRTANTQITAPA